MAKLTDKQKLFADNYIISLNATDAYKKAYNTNNDNTAASNGNKLLRKAKVQNYISQRMKEKDNNIIASQDEVLAHLTAVMRGTLTEEVVVTCGVGEGMSQAIKVDKNTSIKDRNKAAELLGKRYGLFKDKLEADLTQQVIFTGEDDIED